MRRASGASASLRETDALRAALAVGAVVSVVTVVHWTVSRQSLSFQTSCPRCDVRREHHFSGRARINAHHKRLDAWLLFLCSACERTAKIPVIERVPVSRVDPVLLDALTRNDPEVLARLAAEAVGSTGFAVAGPAPDPRLAAHVVLEVATGLRVRVDRILARGLGCSRREVARRCPDGPLSKRARTGMRVLVRPAGAVSGCATPCGAGEAGEARYIEDKEVPG